MDIIYSKTLIAGAWMYPRQQLMLNHIKTKINSYICLEFNSKQKVEFKNLKFDLGIAWGANKADQICDHCENLITFEEGIYRGTSGLNDDNYFSFLEQCSIMGYDMVFKETDDSYRWDKLCKDLNLQSVDLKRGGDSIILLLFSPDDYTNKLNDKQYLVRVIETIERIRKVTNRKIIIRPHPETQHNFIMKLKVIAYKYFKVFLVLNKTLEEQLDEAYCCVVFGNSTAGVHSLLRGVPIIALSEGKLYKSVTNTIENIENLDYEVDLTNWKNGLGYSMWQVSDFESGEAWNYILK